MPDRPFDPEGVRRVPGGLARRGARGADHLGADPGRGDAGRRATMREKIDEWFVPESVAASAVLDGAAIVAGDFRIDAGGHMRFAVFADARHHRAPDRPDRHPDRRDRDLQGDVDARAGAGARDPGPARRDRGRAVGAGARSRRGRRLATRPSCGELLQLAAELESLHAQTSFRFGATAGLRGDRRPTGSGCCARNAGTGARPSTNS